MPVGKGTKKAKKKIPALESEALEMVPLTVSLEKDIVGRLYKMKKAKGFPYEQDLIRLGTVEMLERAGF